MTGQWRGTGLGGLAQWMFTTAISELHCVNKWLEPNWREARSQPHRHAGWDGDKDPEASFVPSLLTCHIRPVCGSRDGGTCGTMTAAPPRSAPLAIPMFFVVRAQFIPESARFNVSTGNTQAALATLQHIARMNRSALPEGRLVEPVLVSPGGRSSPCPGGHPGVPFVTGGQRDKGHYA